jgi:hypothetical protein
MCPHHRRSILGLLTPAIFIQAWLCITYDQEEVVYPTSEIVYRGKFQSSFITHFCSTLVTTLLPGSLVRPSVLLNSWWTHHGNLGVK